MKKYIKTVAIFTVPFVLSSLISCTSGSSEIPSSESSIIPVPSSSEVDPEIVLPKEVEIPSSINLAHSNEEEIRAYYAPLLNKDNAEKTGKNLLKNLKPILQNGMTYLSYYDVWQSAKITERDWQRSPLDTIPGTYDEDSDSILNYICKADDPYLEVMYRNDNGKHEIRMSAYHNPKPGIGGLNREHIWPKSKGFPSESKKDPKGPAGTDIHHLIISDAKCNQNAHNNFPYGNVTNDEREYEKTEDSYIGGNYFGYSEKYKTKVFEPYKDDKGDIARACFYMIARYNNLSGFDTISGGSYTEPNLDIKNLDHAVKGNEQSTASKAVHIGFLDDLLAWHKEDPVDNFEIYRNDLIYHNFQNNRNPFIDFPSWVDVVFGNDDSKIANPEEDLVSLYGLVA